MTPVGSALHSCSLTLFCRPVLSLCLSLSPSFQRAHKSVRQDTRQEETVPPIPLCCYTTRLRAASSPPATCPARSRVLLSPPPPLARVSRRLFSLSTHSSNYSTTSTTTTTTTARRCLYHQVHASFDVANGLSYFHHQLRAAFTHSFILTHHPQAGHLTHHFHHNIYHTHTRLTRTAIHHPRTSHKHPRSGITLSSDHYTLTQRHSPITTTLDAQQRKPWPISQREDEPLRRRIWRRRAQKVQHGKHLWRPLPTGHAWNWHCKTPCETCFPSVADY